MEINSRKRQEEEVVEEMEKKRVDEKELGREEIIYSRMEQPNKETIHKFGNLPMCIRTPRMLIIGESGIY